MPSQARPAPRAARRSAGSSAASARSCGRRFRSPPRRTAPAARRFSAACGRRNCRACSLRDLPRRKARIVPRRCPGSHSPRSPRRHQTPCNHRCRQKRTARTAARPSHSRHHHAATSRCRRGHRASPRAPQTQRSGRVPPDWRGADRAWIAARARRSAYGSRARALHGDRDGCRAAAREKARTGSRPTRRRAQTLWRAPGWLTGRPAGQKSLQCGILTWHPPAPSLTSRIIA